MINLIRKDSRLSKMAKERLGMDGIVAAERQRGFSIVELILVLTIVVILVAITVPAVSLWLPNYHLRSAAMDIFANMQYAKTEAVRTNSDYAMVFDPGNGEYSLVSSPGDDGIFGTGDTNEQVVNTIRVFDYGSNIAFGHSGATKNFEDGGGTFPADEVSYTGPDNVVVFNSRGMCNAGSVYLQNNKDRTYAVGTWMSGVLRIAKWDGSAWK